MRQEDHEPVCIVNGCGRTQVHRVGECAPDDAPTYSDGAEVQALVDDALTGGVAVCDCGHRVTWHHDTRGCGYLGYAEGKRCECRLSSDDTVARIVAARMSAAVKQALNDAAQFLEDTAGIGRNVSDYTNGWYAALDYCVGHLRDVARGADL